MQRERLFENFPELVVVPDSLCDSLTVLRTGVDVSQNIPAPGRSPEIDKALLREYGSGIAGAVVVDRQKIHRILGHGVELEDVFYIAHGSGAGECPPVVVRSADMEGLSVQFYRAAVLNRNRSWRLRAAVSYIAEIFFLLQIYNNSSVQDRAFEGLAAENAAHAGVCLEAKVDQKLCKQRVELKAVAAALLNDDLLKKSRDFQRDWPVEIKDIQILKYNTTLMRIDQPVQLFQIRAGCARYIQTFQVSVDVRYVGIKIFVHGRKPPGQILFEGL